MAKRKTKAQREREKYEALWQRVYDVVCGACGRAFDEDIDTETCEWLSLEEASRVIPALRALFAVEDFEGSTCPGNEWLFSLHNLDHFDSPGSITDYFFEHGVRA